MIWQHSFMSAAPARYVLHYWPIKARAYLPGVIAAHGGLGMQLVPTDEPAGVSFDSIEAKLPFGQLPVLVVDGQTYIAQSNAIKRFLVCADPIRNYLNFYKWKIRL
jgi:glutathione S-transferase